MSKQNIIEVQPLLGDRLWISTRFSSPNALQDRLKNLIAMRDYYRGKKDRERAKECQDEYDNLVGKTG